MRILRPIPAPLVALAASALLILNSGLSGAQGPLSGAPSPHLRHHSNGPVQWLPWGSVAFAKAADEKKLIYASIGYHACYWCRLMDRESFRDEEIAAMLNDRFVPVKVDRLLRPDIDLAFRTYSQATGNSSGWPVNVWITPAGNPVSVGSYFPPRGTGNGSPSLIKVVKHIEKQWSEHPKYVHEQSIRDLEKIRGRLARKPLDELDPIDPQVGRDSFYTTLAASFDPVSGGFDAAVKFPRPETIQALVELAKTESEDSFRKKQIVKMVSRTFDGMLAGGIVDPLDGGLFRYANDASWRVPQFEKMLVDQARFAHAALDAFEFTANPRYAAAARRALQFARTTLAAPGGGFCASLAADGESLGDYYIWQAADIEALLTSEEFTAFSRAFGVRVGGNLPSSSSLAKFPVGTNILRGAEPEAHAPAAGSTLASAVAKVVAARAKRTAPDRNATVLTGNNGLMIGALARAGKVLSDPELTKAATDTAQFVLGTLRDHATGGLVRAVIDERKVGDGFAEDYVFLARGLIDLHEATGSPTALATAISLQAVADEKFFDTSAGLYHLSTIANKDALPIELWPIPDTDLPSINGLAALNLIDLARLSGSARSAKVANVLTAVSPEFDRNPAALPSAMRALLRLGDKGTNR